MLDEKEFSDMVKEYNEFDEVRESLIRKSRDVVKLSKQVIYCIHRGELSSAKKFCDKMCVDVKALDKIASKNPALLYSGSQKVAVQEFVEALCYYRFVADKRIPSRKELGVSSEFYLLGLCDLCGELVRNAINSGSKGDFVAVDVIKELVVEIYERLLQFDFRNSELRSKFDSVKYDVKKLEDVVFQIKLKQM